MNEYENMDNCIIYHGFEVEEMPRIGENPGYVRLTYDFEIPGKTSYSPEFIIPSEEEDLCSENTFLNLAFHLGMAELMYYLDCERIKTVVIEPFGLAKEQQLWWKSAIEKAMTRMSYTIIQVQEEDLLPSAFFEVENEKNDKIPVLLNITNDKIRKNDTFDGRAANDIEKEFPGMTSRGLVEISHRMDFDYDCDIINQDLVKFYIAFFASTIWAYIHEESFFSFPKLEIIEQTIVDSAIEYEKEYIGSGTRLVIK